MTAAAGSSVITEGVGEIGFGPNQEKYRKVKSLIVETEDTADAGNTIAVTLADHGITTVLGVQSWVHTTNNSVIATEANTTAVSAGVLTVTVAAGTDDDKRIVQVFYI